jgi:hypothetical protein
MKLGTAKVLNDLVEAASTEKKIVSLCQTFDKVAQVITRCDSLLRDPVVMYGDWSQGVAAAGRAIRCSS